MGATDKIFWNPSPPQQPNPGTPSTQSSWRHSEGPLYEHHITLYKEQQLVQASQPTCWKLGPPDELMYAAVQYHHQDNNQLPYGYGSSPAYEREPYFDNQPQLYFHTTDPYRQPTSTYTDSWQKEQLVYRAPQPPWQHYFNTQPPPSHDYHQPPKLSSQQPLQVPPSKTYQPPPPPPLILDCDRVEEGFADSAKKLSDSSAGFGGVEKVEKMGKSSPNSARKEKPVQGCIEIECSRQLNAFRIEILQAQIDFGDSIVENSSLELLDDLSHVRDVASMNHRSTSLDADARLIPPQNNTPCLGIGCVDELYMSVLNYQSHNLQATQKSSHQPRDDFSNLGGKRCTNLTEMKQGVRSEKLEESLIVNHHVANVDMNAFKAVSGEANGKIMIISYGLLELTSTVEPFLSAMGNKLLSFESHVGTSSKSKTVLDLFEGIHFVASLEAISLGTQAAHRGIDEGRRLTIDPGGDSSPKLLFATLLVVSWSPP